MTNGSFDPFDPANLAIKDLPAIPANVPRKVQKRREQFVQMPLYWIEILAKAKASGLTFAVAAYVMHQYWKHHNRPFKLANGMLKYDGISRQTKWRALSQMEKLGLIRIDRQSGKSPIVHPLGL